MRTRILKFFNASPLEYSVIFTSGATGALHTVGEIFPWSKDSKFYYLSEVLLSMLPLLGRITIPLLVLEVCFSDLAVLSVLWMKRTYRQMIHVSIFMKKMRKIFLDM